MSASVIVVGAGGAGLAAAIEAHDAGAAVEIYEAAETIGGSTAMSAGVIYAAGTDVQREAGIEDDPQDMYRHYMAITHHTLEPRMIRAFCEGTRDTVKWLQDLGLTFPHQGLHDGGADGVRRSHLPTPIPTDLGPSGGAAIVATLVGELERREIPVRLGTRVSALVREGGAVRGVELESGERVDADAVIMTTGGIGHNRELRERLIPRSARYGDDVWYIGAPTVRGDGVAMGERAGALIGPPDECAMLPTPSFEHVPDVFYASWLVFVNRAGRRFITETAPYSFLPEAIEAQPDGTCWAILDHRGFSGAGDDPALSDPYGYGVELASNWSSRTLAEQLEQGKVKCAVTLEDLATSVGIDPRGLVSTIAKYNADVAAGHDTVFEKPRPHLPIDQAPYYAVAVTPATFGMSFTGLRIDDQARVLDLAGVPIPGLFAAGETTGGVQGVRYVASGAGVGNALTFGRRAGVTAATYATVPVTA